jgi:hypothetical protein
VLLCVHCTTPYSYAATWLNNSISTLHTSIVIEAVDAISLYCSVRKRIKKLNTDCNEQPQVIPIHVRIDLVRSYALAVVLA